MHIQGTIYASDFGWHVSYIFFHPSLRQLGFKNRDTQIEIYISYTITFDNTTKAWFSNKKYNVVIQTCLTQFENNTSWKTGFDMIFEDHWYTNQLPFSIRTVLVRKKMLKVRKSPPQTQISTIKVYWFIFLYILLFSECHNCFDS